MGIIEEREKRVQWFMDARFGMFIHWGLYAIPGRGEWVMGDEEIDTPVYEKYFEEWNPDHYNPKQWAKAAKNAGMKYAAVSYTHLAGGRTEDIWRDWVTGNRLCRRDFPSETR